MSADPKDLPQTADRATSGPGSTDSFVGAVAEAPSLPGIVLPRPGDRLADRFELLQELGQGGFGRVFLARDLQLGRDVAVKVLGARHGRPLSAVELQLFDREAKVTARLAHPGIVTIFDWGSWNAFPYLVLEHLRGEPLSRSLRSARVPVRRAITIAVEVVRALVHAHQAGVLHLDLKPDNVFVLEGGHVKVLDFGIATLDRARESVRVALQDPLVAPRDEPALTGPTGGTPAYMAPEQWRGAAVDARTDVWAVGVVLFEMLTGKLPFRTDDHGGEALGAGRAPSVRADRSGVPAELEGVVTKALEKDPKRRHASAQELLDALERVRRQLEAPRGRRWRLAALGAGAVTAGIVAWALWPDAQDGRRPPPRTTNHQRVTFVGDAEHPALTPDGQSVAYLSGGKILVQRLGRDGPPLELFAQRSAYDLRWSPDGSELLFRHWRHGRGTQSLLVPALGGAVRAIPNTLRDRHAFSPDGTRIASAGPTPEIRFIDKATGSYTRLEPRGVSCLHQIDWSPNGRFLVFQTHAGGGEALWAISTDGKTQEKLLEDSQLLVSPRWSPRGDAIYYLRSLRGTLHKLPFDERTGRAAGPPRALLTGLQAGPDFTVSANGRRLAYTRAPFHSNLVRLGRDGKPARITKDKLARGHPSISPDGKWVAYARLGPQPNGNIFTKPLGGGQSRQLTFLSGYSYAPVWSPDGREIAFISRDDTGAKLRIIAADGTGLRTVERANVSPSTELANTLLTWAPGRAILYALPGFRGFRAFDPAAGTDVPFRAPKPITLPRYSPDGRSVAVLEEREGGGLAVLSSEGMWLRRLATESLRPLGWSRDGKWVYAERGSEVVRLLASGAGALETVVDLRPPGTRVEVAMAPDATRFVAVVVDQDSDVWIADDFDP